MSQKSLRPAVVSLLLTLLLPLTAAAASYSGLLPLLIDLPGFHAEAAEGVDMAQEGALLVAASRSYEKGDQILDAAIMAGSSAVVDAQSGIQLETPEVKIVAEKVDGFDVRRYHDTQENGGSVFVLLGRNGDKGGIFVLGYSGMNAAEGLKLARRFDWKAIKAQTDTLLK